jgi:uncharacterized membrane protein
MSRIPDQTITGLLLMVVAFALAWIPFVDIVGGILALVGLIYLWNGRRELGPVHSDEVKVGVLLLVVAVGVGVAGAIALVAATFSFNVTLNGTQPMVTHPPVSLALEAAVVVILTVAAALGAACLVKLPYSLGDPTARKLLLVGGALEVAFAALYSVSEVQSLAAVESVFGTGASPGPLPSPLLVGLLLGVPDLVFLVAYSRVRKRLLDGDLPRAPAVTPLGH